jgi:hypothetical protein
MFNQPPNNIMRILLILILGYSCNPASKNPDIKDSVLGRPADLSFSKDFLVLKGFFLKDSIGHMDSTEEIPLALVKSYLKDDIDTSYNRSVNPIRLIQNKFGYFFIIRQNCIAGGDCAIFRLLVFNGNGQFIRNEQLGMLTADESERTIFQYRLLMDSSIVTYEIKYDEEKGEEVDTVIKQVKLIQ